MEIKRFPIHQWLDFQQTVSTVDFLQIALAVFKSCVRRLVELLLKEMIFGRDTSQNLSVGGVDSSIRCDLSRFGSVRRATEYLAHFDSTSRTQDDHLASWTISGPNIAEFSDMAMPTDPAQIDF